MPRVPYLIYILFNFRQETGRDKLAIWIAIAVGIWQRTIGVRFRATGGVMEMGRSRGTYAGRFC
jgi:hypothetical protein